MTETLYAVGYRGAAWPLARLRTWRHFERLEDELARRILSLIDASIADGRPVGIGASVRTTTGQWDLFHSRHHPAAPGERSCCTIDGVRYALDAGEAHAAPGGLSMHEDTVLPSGECLASDLIGNMAYVVAHAAEFGLRHFGRLGEKWHVQPIELPAPRRRFKLSMMPLKRWDLPVRQQQQATKITAPKPTIAKGRGAKAEVRELQAMANFWGWRDALGHQLVVDGQPGAKTVQAIRSMQRALGITDDGVYGRQSQRALQGFLDLMVAKAAR